MFHQPSTTVPPAVSTTILAAFQQASSRGTTTPYILRIYRRRLRAAYFVTNSPARRGYRAGGEAA